LLVHSALCVDVHQVKFREHLVVGTYPGEDGVHGVRLVGVGSESTVDSLVVGPAEAYTPVGFDDRNECGSPANGIGIQMPLSMFFWIASSTLVVKAKGT